MRDQVLVLLPTSTNELLARWQGPYKVLRRVGKVTYLVDMYNTRKHKLVLHDMWICFGSGMPLWQHPTLQTKPQRRRRSSLGGEWVKLTKASQPAADWTAADWAKWIDRGVQQCLAGHTSLVEHRIESRTATPVKLPPYRILYAYRDSVDKELQEILDTGIIEPSRSAWASPIVTVKNKDGNIRLCLDYQRLNSVTTPDTYPMPRIDELIHRLGTSKYITTLDLSRGYWQVPIAPEDQAKTAYMTPAGLFQFRVMPFGLCGAPATFQRMMDSLLQGVESFAGAYLDDLVIHSKTWQEHCDHIRQVLQRLRKQDLTAKPAKCSSQCSNVYI